VEKYTIHLSKPTEYTLEWTQILTVGFGW
jgi:hypothetical protein